MIGTYLRFELLYIYGIIQMSSYYYFDIITCPQVHKKIVEVKTNNSAWDCLLLTYVELQQQPLSDKSRAVCVCVCYLMCLFLQDGPDKRVVTRKLTFREDPRVETREAFTSGGNLQQYISSSIRELLLQSPASSDGAVEYWQVKGLTDVHNRW